jgi:CubicO group peptidase (beta-lactamase class C family)
VVSALVGVLLDARVLPGIDTPLARYFPELNGLDEAQPPLTLRHALTMTAGLQWNEDIPYTDARNDEIVMTRSSDPLRYVLTRPVVTTPGSTWRYNGGLTQVLAAVVERASGREIESYARDVLFTPLGIGRFEWVGNLAGMPSAASGLRLRARDLAKFGSLYLHEGQWNGVRVLSADWVEESTKRRLTFPNQSMRGYGFHWWHSCIPSAGGPVEAHVAQGNGGQRVVVLPALRAVVSIFAGRYNEPAHGEALVTDHIIPAYKSEIPRGVCPSVAK